MTFGEWLDFWYQNYSKPRLRPKSQLDYENSIYKHIILALDRAVTDGLIRINPAADSKLPGQALKDLNLLTQEEMQRFLIQAKEEGYYELFLLELATGLRRGEVLALQWDDLKLDTGELPLDVPLPGKGGLASRPGHRPETAPDHPETRGVQKSPLPQFAPPVRDHSPGKRHGCENPLHHHRAHLRQDYAECLHPRH